MKHSSFFIAFFTTIVRYYDYALFGLSAAILSKNFLPEASQNTQLLSFFAIFSASVIARPIGSIIFGFIGDKYGRTISIKISVILATISTTLIGITPNYNSIGWLATLILIFCRMLFLTSLAGEIDSIKIYVAEKVGTKYRNFANGIISFCSQVGALLAATVYHYSMNSIYSEYLWRWTFIIGGLMSLTIIAMSKFFKESKEFLYYKSHNLKIANPKSNLTVDTAVDITTDHGFLRIILNNKAKFFTSLLISGCSGGVYHFLVIFLGTFIAKMALIITTSNAQIMNILLISIYAITSVLAGFCADKAHPKKQIIIALILSLLTIIILQYQPATLLYCSMLLIALAPFYIVPLQIILQSIFPTNIRMRMYSLSHSLGSMIFSSTTPFFCMLLWQYFHSIAIVLGFFIVLIVIISSSVCYLFSSKYILLD